MPKSTFSEDMDSTMHDDSSNGTSPPPTASAPITTSSPTTTHRPTTPTHAQHTLLTSELSPPDSQSRNTYSAVPTNGPSNASNSAVQINANGKRALMSSATDLPSRGLDDTREALVDVAGRSEWEDQRGEQDREMDEDSVPGASWNNKKVLEDITKAMEQIVDRDIMVKRKSVRIVLV